MFLKIKVVCKGTYQTNFKAQSVLNPLHMTLNKYQVD